MSGKPPIPAAPSNFPWAVSTPNYPAGPNLWNSQPLKLAPVVDYVTPDTHLDAEEHNYVLNQYSTVDQNIATNAHATDQSILDWAGQDVALNWYPKQNATDVIVNTGLDASATTGRWMAMTYQDPSGGLNSLTPNRWVALVEWTNSTPHWGIVTSTGTDPATTESEGDWNFQALGTTLTSTSPVLTASSIVTYQSRYIFFTVCVATALAVYKLDTAGPTLTNVLTISSSTITATAMATIGTTIVLFVTDSTGTGSKTYYSTDIGVTWSAGTLMTASGVGAVTDRVYVVNTNLGNVGGPALNMVASTATGWLSGQSIDGQSWTFLPQSGLDVKGLGHGLNGANQETLFVAVKVSSIETDIRGSQNGASWGTVFSSTVADAWSDVVALGDLVVGWYTYSAYRSFVFSPNSGFNWYLSPSSLYEGNPVKLTSNGYSQLAAHTFGGSFLRFSFANGLPPVLTF